MTGKMIFSDETARWQLVSEGEVVTFRVHRRTTGLTWWSETRLGKKKGNVTLEELGEVSPTMTALRPYRKRSGFETVGGWIAAIERLNGALPKRGYLYQATSEGRSPFDE